MRGRLESGGAPSAWKGARGGAGGGEGGRHFSCLKYFGDIAEGIDSIWLGKGARSTTEKR